MKPLKSFLLSLFSGMLFSGIMGYFLTKESTALLLEKNRALLQAGLVALPGAGHLQVMEGAGPALAGGLFFALSLGIGGGALSWLTGLVLGRLPSHVAALFAAPLFIPSVYSLVKGAPLPAAYMALAAITGLWFGLKASGKIFACRRETLATLAVFFILAAGFSTWRFSGLSPFVKIRDSALMGSLTLRPVSDFYYRWTLYPAEAIKPLDSATIPIVKADVPEKDAFCAQAWDMGFFCAPPGMKVYDLEASARDGFIQLTYKGRSAKWRPGDTRFNRDELKTLTDSTDTARPLRRATFISLMYGLPMAAIILLTLLISESTTTAKVRLSMALALALGIAWAGLPDDASLKHAQMAAGKGYASLASGMLASSDPVERFYGAFAAASDPSSNESKLIEALDDPVLNVRYQAATALGGATSARARERLLQMLSSGDEWYVKFRAYNALLKMGWHP